jgi:hypothetical protein
MRKLSDFLDLAKARTGSDYATAQNLGVDRAAISMMRKSGRIGEENALKLAELTESDIEEILVISAIARSNGEIKEAWIRLGKKAGIGKDSVYYVKFFAYACWLNFCDLFGSFHMESKKWHDQKRAIFTNCVGIV